MVGEARHMRFGHFSMISFPSPCVKLFVREHDFCFTAGNYQPGWPCRCTSSGAMIQAPLNSEAPMKSLLELLKRARGLLTIQEELNASSVVRTNQMLRPPPATSHAQWLFTLLVSTGKEPDEWRVEPRSTSVASNAHLPRRMDLNQDTTSCHVPGLDSRSVFTGFT